MRIKMLLVAVLLFYLCGCATSPSQGFPEDFTLVYTKVPIGAQQEAEVYLRIEKIPNSSPPKWLGISGKEATRLLSNEELENSKGSHPGPQTTDTVLARKELPLSVCRDLYHYLTDQGFWGLKQYRPSQRDREGGSRAYLLVTAHGESKGVYQTGESRKSFGKIVDRAYGLLEK